MKSFPLVQLSILVIIVLPLPLACAGNGGNGHRWHNVSVSISPSIATVQVSQSQQFRATVSGTSNTAVNWLVNGIVSGNSAVGTISSAGVYTAPGNVPSVSVKVAAQSIAQPNSFDYGTVSVVSPPPVSVIISPTSTSLQVGQTQQFAATVSGTTNTAVNWMVNGLSGGNATVGTISAKGMYSAPPTVPASSVTVTAQSSYYPASSASATVSIASPIAHQASLSWNPSAASVSGYNIYRSTQPNAAYTRMNSTPDTATVYTDSSVQPGQSYYYAVTAVDANGESAYSNIAQAVIP
jgi:hypothetical protein